MQRNIAIIDHIGNKGGHHYYCLNILYAFQELGHKVFYFTNFLAPDTTFMVEKVYDRDIKKDFKGFFNIMGGTLKAIRVCRQKKVSHVMFHLFEAGWLNFILLSMMKAAGFKIIGVVHDVSNFAAEDSDFAKRMIYGKLTDSLVVHNQYSYEELKKEISPEHLAKVYKIKHGCYTRYIDNTILRSEALSALKLPPEYDYILFFGLIKKIKGLEILLEALKDTAENVKLIIAGKPWQNDFTAYEEIINRHGLEDKIVKYIRFIEDDEKDLFFNGASAIILPYRKIYQSGVLLMAMSYGTPVIASELPATKEIIDHGFDGLLFDQERPDALSQQILDLLSNTALQKKLSENAMHKIKAEYSWNVIAKQYEPILN